jgi:hypothetical protein
MNKCKSCGENCNGQSIFCIDCGKRILRDRETLTKLIQSFEEAYHIDFNRTDDSLLFYENDFDTIPITFTSPIFSDIEEDGSIVYVSDTMDSREMLSI